MYKINRFFRSLFCASKGYIISSYLAAGTMAFLSVLAMSCLLLLLPTGFCHILERSTSMLTLIFIIGCGTTASVMLYKYYEGFASYIFVAACWMFSPYFLYVGWDFGIHHPNVSANLFNISTMIFSVIILLLAKKLKNSKLEKNKNERGRTNKRKCN